MIENIPWIPEFHYYKYKIKSPINLEKALEFIKKKIALKEVFESIETLFWTVSLLYEVDKLDFLDKESVIEYIQNLKHKKGGYKYSEKSKEPDICSTFFSISVLKFFDFYDNIKDEDIEFIKKLQDKSPEGNGGFIHCHFSNCHIACNGKSSFEFTFYAVSTLMLLDLLHEIDIEKLINFLGQNTSEELESIYQTLSLKMINNKNIIDIEKINSIIHSSQIPRSGFGIKGKFPSIEHTFLIGICTDLLNQLDSIEFGGIFDFIKTMQQSDGGLTDEFTSISSQISTIKSTSQGILSLFYIWDKFIEAVENEILKEAQNSKEVYLNPIGKKYSVNLNFIQIIANWLIGKKWIEGKILDKSNSFQNYFKQQNATSQNIIKELMNIDKTFQKQKILNINEFSDGFDFSNPLERVKLVFNDLIINKFLIGNIKTHKKKYILENFSFINRYVYLSETLTDTKILDEKKQIKEAKEKLLNLNLNLIEYILFNSEKIKNFVNEENISEAKEFLNQLIEFIEKSSSQFENLIDKINSDNKFVSINLLNDIYEKNWSNIKRLINELLEATEVELKEIIKEKELIINERLEQVKEEKSIETLNSTLREFIGVLNQFQVDLHAFFAKNYTNHEDVNDFIKKIEESLENSDSKMNSKLSEITKDLQIEKFKKEIDIISTSWKNRHQTFTEEIKYYQEKIQNRIKLIEFIDETASDFEKFYDENGKQIKILIDEEKIEEGFELLNNSLDKYDEMVLNQKIAFKEHMDSINNEIPDFSKFSSDIKSNWQNELKEQEKKWNNVLSELREKLQTNLELFRKSELKQKMNEDNKIIQNLIDEFKDLTSKLIESNSLNDAKSKINESFSTINEKIKSSNQEIKDFIKINSREFKNFKEITNDLIQNWDLKTEELTSSLNSVKQELENEIKHTASAGKKSELIDLIDFQIRECENILNQFITRYNNIVQSGKELGEFESKFELDLSYIKNYISLSDDKITNFIKSSSKIHPSFTDFINEEVKIWNDFLSSIEKRLESIINTINEEIFVQKIEIIINENKVNRINLASLSKALKYKLEHLRSHINDLIANSKLIGELDSDSNTFILKEKHIPAKIKESPEEIIEIKISDNNLDTIKKDISCLRYLIVIQKEVGASIYNKKFGDWKLDTDLVAGFLSAIQKFSLEIKKENVPITRMEYKGFGILMEQGDYVHTALIIDGRETEWLRGKIRAFTNEFEKKFKDDLKDWEGELGLFKDAGLIVNRVFQLFRI